MHGLPKWFGLNAGLFLQRQQLKDLISVSQPSQTVHIFARSQHSCQILSVLLGLQLLLAKRETKFGQSGGS